MASARQSYSAGRKSEKGHVQRRRSKQAASVKSLGAGKSRQSGKGSKGKGREFIEVPRAQSEDEGSGVDGEGGDEGMDVDEGLDEPAVAAFAKGLDQRGIARSRAELDKEHRRNKLAHTVPSRASAARHLKGPLASQPELSDASDGERLEDLDEDDFALLGSDDDDLEDLDDWSADLASAGSVSGSSEEISLDVLSEDSSGSSRPAKRGRLDGTSYDSDLERAYTSKKRKRSAVNAPPSWGAVELKLPIRDADGSIRRFPTAGTQGSKTSRVIVSAEVSSDSAAESDEAEDKAPVETLLPRSDPYGARFGRTPLRTLLRLPNKRERLLAAKREIADLAKEVIADPEMGLPTLKRLMGFAVPIIKSEGTGEPNIRVESNIRAFALLSLLAVFLDIIPGYRIRPLSEQERDKTVSQQVARQRDHEEGLVSTYRRFLGICEAEVTSNSQLAPVAFRCLCSLLRDKTHFNFSQNIMEVVVRKLGRREWDGASQECLDSVRVVLEKDMAGEDSLQIMRLISRTIKARNFVVKPALLAVLIHLRLKDEIGEGIKASESRIYGHQAQFSSRTPAKARKGKKGDTKEPVLSKKARKAAKDRAVIEKEIREAEDGVRREDRERHQTETLKLLFALYFRVIKLPGPSSPLLPAALDGLARFAHLVNVDFFRDLLNVLKDLIQQGRVASSDQNEDSRAAQAGALSGRPFREQLLCVVTAFELLSGQGEALNIDLADFVNALYAMILPLAFSTTIENHPGEVSAGPSIHSRESCPIQASEADLLFRALQAAFVTTRIPSSPTRVLAFAKRLLTASLHWPPRTAVRCLVFIRKLLIKVPRLEGLLSTEEKTREGVWKGEVDDPALARGEGAAAWEVLSALNNHWDTRVREEAVKLARWNRECA